MGGILYVHTYWNEPEQVLTGKQEHSKRDQHVQKTHPLNCEKVIVSDRRLQKSKRYIQKHHREVCAWNKGVYECGNIYNI